MHGFFQRLLAVDLSNRSWRAEPLGEAATRRYLGGKGLGTQLLLERNPTGVDPFSPDNRFVIGLGPATDSPIHGSCRHGIYAKSPLTGFYAESYSGGSAAIAMSRTGYDAFVLEGAADAPVWLEVSEDAVHFHPADDLWGRDTHATEAAVKKRLGISGAGILVIGPAGENRVRFAVVKNDRWRVSGRTGMGAVLGSKKVKAIAFHGGRSRPHADPAALKSYAREMLKEMKDHPVTEAYRNRGTPMMVDLLNSVGGFPTRYWSAGRLEGWEQINADAMAARCRPRPKACRTCFLACGKRIEIQSGRHRGLQLEGPEYETLYAFGGLCMIDQIEEIAFLNDLCDRLGIDTISAGNLAAFAVEAARRGKIQEPIDYGEPDQVAALLNKIVRREGIGGLLAEGIRPASEELELAEIAVHVKGLEPAGYDPRVLKGMGLAYAVSDRGACHLRSTFYKPELSGMIDPDRIDGKAELFVDFEDRCTLFDALVLCRFYRDLYPWEALSDIIAMTTGMRMAKPELRALAGRITDSTRRFNLGEGLTAADDRLPRRLLNQALPEGGRVTEQEVGTLVADYYRIRGWDRDGIPGRRDDTSEHQDR
jgi:aldehyde:ferredoxin oxidoreductase